MKKMLGLLLVAVFVVSASAAFAQCGACPAGTAKPGKPPYCVALEKLTLTDDQKAKVAGLQKECMANGCSPEARKKMAEGLKGVLTDEQYKQWEQACAAAMKGARKHEKKSE